MIDDKPTPRCPYCGEEMRESGSISHRWYICPYCLSAGPRKIIDVTGYPNEELAVVDATQKAREAAMKHWQEPNRVLTLDEVRERYEEGTSDSPLWIDFKQLPFLSRWYALQISDVFFATDTVECYLTGQAEKYNFDWRCWLRKPTQEEMEGTPWEGGQHEKD